MALSAPAFAPRDRCSKPTDGPTSAVLSPFFRARCDTLASHVLPPVTTDRESARRGTVDQAPRHDRSLSRRSNEEKQYNCDLLPSPLGLCLSASTALALTDGPVAQCSFYRGTCLRRIGRPLLRANNLRTQHDGLPPSHTCKRAGIRRAAATAFAAPGATNVTGRRNRQLYRVALHSHGAAALRRIETAGSGLRLHGRAIRFS